MNDYFELKGIVQILNSAIYHPTDEEGWKQRYDIVFSENFSKRALKLYYTLVGENFTYYDPDTSYQEDVEAFVHALTEAFNGIPTQI